MQSKQSLRCKQTDLLDKKVISGNSSLPGVCVCVCVCGGGGLSNVKLPYKRITSLLSELHLSLSFFQDNPHAKEACYRWHIL